MQADWLTYICYISHCVLESPNDWIQDQLKLVRRDFKQCWKIMLKEFYEYDKDRKMETIAKIYIYIYLILNYLISYIYKFCLSYLYILSTISLFLILNLNIFNKWKILYYIYFRFYWFSSKLLKVMCIQWTLSYMYQ